MKKVVFIFLCTFLTIGGSVISVTAQYYPASEAFDIYPINNYDMDLYPGYISPGGGIVTGPGDYIDSSHTKRTSSSFHPKDMLKPPRLSVDYQTTDDEYVYAIWLTGTFSGIGNDISTLLRRPIDGDWDTLNRLTTFGGVLENIVIHEGLVYTIATQFDEENTFTIGAPSFDVDESIFPEYIGRGTSNLIWNDSREFLVVLDFNAPDRNNFIKSMGRITKGASNTKNMRMLSNGNIYIHSTEYKDSDSTSFHRALEVNPNDLFDEDGRVKPVKSLNLPRFITKERIFMDTLLGSWYLLYGNFIYQLDESWDFENYLNVTLEEQLFERKPTSLSATSDGNLRVLFETFFHFYLTPNLITRGFNANFNYFRKFYLHWESDSVCRVMGSYRSGRQGIFRFIKKKSLPFSNLSFDGYSIPGFGPSYNNVRLHSENKDSLVDDPFSHRSYVTVDETVDLTESKKRIPELWSEKLISPIGWEASYFSTNIQVDKYAPIDRQRFFSMFSIYSDINDRRISIYRIPESYAHHVYLVTDTLKYREICDGIDNDLDGEIDEGFTTATYYEDVDGDGLGDPLSLLISCKKPKGYVSNKSDSCPINFNSGDDYNGDGIDDVCDPIPVEICDGIDNNLDGQIDEGFDMSTYYEDSDGDGLGDPLSFMTSCTKPNGYVSNKSDSCPMDFNSGDDYNGDGIDDVCDPVPAEICDGIDNNLNGQIDEGFDMTTYYEDVDADGLGDPLSFRTSCTKPTGYVSNQSDSCPMIFNSGDDYDGDGIDDVCDPVPPEICDGIDNNLDGQIDEGFDMTTYYEDSDGDGLGDPISFLVSCKKPTGYVSNRSDSCPMNFNSGTDYDGDGIDDACDPVYILSSNSEEKTDFSFFPNPFFETFFVKGFSGKVELFNITGESLGHFDVDEKITFSYSQKHLSRGVYFLKIIGANVDSKIIRIIKL